MTYPRHRYSNALTQLQMKLAQEIDYVVSDQFNTEYDHEDVSRRAGDFIASVRCDLERMEEWIGGRFARAA